MKHIKHCLISFVCIFFFTNPSFGQFNVLGDATHLGGGEYRLTEALGQRKGAIWFTEPINLIHGFDLTADVFYGDGSDVNGGADGMTFLLHTKGPSQAPTTHGGSLGTGVFAPFFGATLRSWTFDVISFRSPNVGSIVSPTAPLPAADNQYHQLRVTWNPQDDIAEIYFDGNLVVSYPADIITAHLSNNTMVTGGFTASTGGPGGATVHMVKNIVLVRNYPPGWVPTLSEWGLIVLALLILNFGALAIIARSQVVTTGQHRIAFSPKKLPFNKVLFGICLLILATIVVAAFAVSILFFDYEMATADIPGSIITIPLAAYFFHLITSQR